MSIPKDLKRYYGQGDLHFLTFSCYRRRLPLVRSRRARNLWLRVLGGIRAHYRFSLAGYVVMPEHVHLLLSEPPEATPWLVLKALKQRVSRDLRRRKRHAPPGQLSFAFSEKDSGQPRFWQPRFFDINVRSAKKRKEKLEYMHRNPMTRKLVEHPRDWPWGRKGSAGA